MNPERIFEKKVVENREICNKCFRKKAQSYEPSENYPDFAVTRYFRTSGSDLVYPPPKASYPGQVNSGSEPVRMKWKEEDSNEVGEVGETIVATPAVSCECGVIDGERIDGSFPDDWEDRPKDKLEEVALRVYHRLDEQGFTIDYDSFIGSVEEYKASDDYEFGDYEILQDSVADSVSVRPTNA